jgi:hypothetical protein
MNVFNQMIKYHHENNQDRTIYQDMIKTLDFYRNNLPTNANHITAKFLMYIFTETQNTTFYKHKTEVMNLNVTNRIKTAISILKHVYSNSSPYNMYFLNSSIFMDGGDKIEITNMRNEKEMSIITINFVEDGNRPFIFMIHVNHKKQEVRFYGLNTGNKHNAAKLSIIGLFPGYKNIGTNPFTDDEMNYRVMWGFLKTFIISKGGDNSIFQRFGSSFKTLFITKFIAFIYDSSLKNNMKYYNQIHLIYSYIYKNNISPTKVPVAANYITELQKYISKGEYDKADIVSIQLEILYNKDILSITYLSKRINSQAKEIITKYVESILGRARVGHSLKVYRKITKYVEQMDKNGSANEITPLDLLKIFDGDMRFTAFIKLYK